MKNLLFFVMLLCSFGRLGAQIGGAHAYSFLGLSNSTRVQALGGSVTSIRDEDVNLAYQNPGLINPKMSGRLSLTFTDYFAGINFGNAAYAFDVKNAGTAALSMQYISYGTFKRTDNTGDVTGEFSAGEYCLTTGFSRAIDSMFTVGLNLKTIFSNMEAYNSFGMAVDFGVSYLSRDKHFEMGLVMKNVGGQISTYTPGNREKLPFDLQLGASRKLEHVPLRFVFLAHHLHTWDLTYKDPRVPEIIVDPLLGDTIINKIPFANKAMRHLMAGAELNIAKFLVFRLGYNYMRRQEMKVESRLKTVGISWGLGVQINKFALSYSRSAYHLAGSPNQFTISAKLSEFYRKK